MALKSPHFKAARFANNLEADDPKKIVFKQCVHPEGQQEGRDSLKNNTDHGHEAQEDHY